MLLSGHTDDATKCMPAAVYSGEIMIRIGKGAGGNNDEAGAKIESAGDSKRDRPAL